MAEISNRFRVKKGLEVQGDTQLTGNLALAGGNVSVTGNTTLTGNLDVSGPITTPNLAATENSTKVANTAYVQTAIANLIASSPAALDTLNELAAALGDDPNFATTMTNALALKAPLASPALTGTPTGPTAAVATNTTQLATTAYVKSQLYATLASPALSGIPTAPTPGLDTNTTQIATAAFVLAQAASVAPLMNGASAVIGTSYRYARQDHVHQTDSTRAPLASPALTGTPTAPTPAVTDNSTLISTTAYVQNVLASIGWGSKSAPLPGLTTSTIDDNTIPTGMYYLTGTNTGTMPAGDVNGHLLVGREGTGLTAHQLYLDNTTARMFSRAWNTTSWTAWREVAYTDSPAFTGVPTAPTATANTNSTQVATTAYADAIAALKANILNPSFTGTATFAGQVTAQSDVVVSGNISSADFTSFPLVEGGSYVTGSATITGALKIKLPVSYTSSLISFDVDVIEATTDASFKLRISGFAASSNSTWSGATVTQLGGVASRLPNVRFGNDGTTLCVWVGELADVWAYPNVNVSNLHLGDAGLTSAWQAAWALSYVTTYDTVKLGPIAANKTAFINSPTFTGVPAAPTAALGTSTTQLATTAFVIGQAATVTPLINGTAAVGTATKFAREDHVHANDTTKANLSGATFTGPVTVSYVGGVINLNDTSGTGTSGVVLQDAGAKTWGLYTLNAGSNDFAIDRYVSNAFVDAPLRIANATGIVSMPNRVLLSGTSDDGAQALQVGGSIRAANYFIQGQATADSGLLGFSNANGPAVALYGSGTTNAGSMVLKTATVERLRINAAGRILFGAPTDDGSNLLQNAGTFAQAGILYRGGSAALNVGATSAAGIQNFGIGNDSYINTVRFSADNLGAGINIGSSRGTTVGSQGAIQAGDDLGYIFFAGSDGTAISTAAAIIANATDTFSATQRGTHLDFQTVQSGATARNTRVRITDSGRTLIGTTVDDASSSLQVMSQATGYGLAVIRNGTSGQYIGIGAAPAGQTDNYFVAYSVPSNAKSLFFDSTTDASNTAPTAGTVGINMRILGSTKLWINQAGRVGVGAGVVDNTVDQLQVGGSGNFTGGVKVTQGGGAVTINDPTGASHTNVYFQDTNVTSWGLRGDWVNNKFEINRYNSSGVFQDSPLSIDYASGVATFLVSPVAPTPSQLDNSTKLATTAFVRQAQGNAAGMLAFNTSQTLTVGQLGYNIQYFGPSGGIYTLPSAATIPAGYEFTIYNHGSGTLTVKVSGGSDFLYYGSGSTNTTVVLQKGDNLVLAGRSSTEVDIIGGTGSLQYVQGPLLVSPAMSGTPTAPTAATGDISTTVATTAFAQTVADASAIVYSIVFG